MATDLGKVGMVMKGDYNSASTYEALDVVSYGNSLYVAKRSVPAGTVPTNTTYWQQAVSMQGMLGNVLNKGSYSGIRIMGIGVANGDGTRASTIHTGIFAENSARTVTVTAEGTLIAYSYTGDAITISNPTGSLSDNNEISLSITTSTSGHAMAYIYAVVDITIA